LSIKRAAVVTCDRYAFEWLSENCPRPRTSMDVNLHFQIPPRSLPPCLTVELCAQADTEQEIEPTCDASRCERPPGSPPAGLRMRMKLLVNSQKIF